MIIVGAAFCRPHNACIQMTGWCYWASPFDGLIDLENEDDGVQTLVMGGHEISLK